MNLAAVTRSNVLNAIGEFDSLGRRSFLSEHHFGPARTYFIDYETRLYDSKAIMGYAHGVATGEFLGSKDFTGGEQAVVRPLERLGFDVLSVRNPPWTRDEIILAGELVLENNWRQLESGDSRVRDLSEALQSPAIHPGRRHPDFRNPAGVARKTWNIVNESSNGNRLDREVFLDYQARPDEMRAEAKRIRERLRAVRVDPRERRALGFDRAYRGKPCEGAYPSMQSTSPEAKEAAIAEHDALCRRLIEHLGGTGLLAGEMSDPAVDVSWLSASGEQMIAEVKSCLADNETTQLRLGLGQVLEYRHRLATTGIHAKAILLVSRVSDPVWFHICKHADVLLLDGRNAESWSF